MIIYSKPYKVSRMLTRKTVAGTKKQRQRPVKNGGKLMSEQLLQVKKFK